MCTCSVHACRVILEPLSPEVDCLLAGHNQEAVDNLVAYITAYISSSAEALPPGNVLPLSGHTYPPHAACTHSQQQLALGAGVSSDLAQEGGGTSKLGGQVSGALQAYRKQHRISSPFVSLSGMGIAVRVILDSACHHPCKYPARVFRTLLVMLPVQHRHNLAYTLKVQHRLSPAV